MRELLSAALTAGALSLVAGAAEVLVDTSSMHFEVQAASFRRVETPRYVVEVPKGWEVGEETPFGQREITPDEGSDEYGGSMSTMTGPGLGRQSWDELYKTANFYITRFSPGGEKMKATPYRLGKTKQGYASCSWDMVDAEGNPVQRHVILKRADSDILALSVKLPSGSTRESRSQLDITFEYLVDTAVMR